MQGELPVSGLRFSHAHNTSGQASFSIPLNIAPEVANPRSLSPNQTAVYIERSGLIEWSGFLAGWTADLAAETVAIEAVSMWGLISGNPLRQIGQRYNQADQAHIAGNLISWAQISELPTWREDPPGVWNTDWDRFTGLYVIDPETVSPARATGVIRDRSYEYGKDLGEAVEQLSAVIDGFTFTIASERRPSESGDRIRNRLTVVYPRVRETSIVLRHSDNCLINQVRSDGSNLATMAVQAGTDQAEEGQPVYHPQTAVNELHERIAHFGTYNADQDLSREDTIRAKAEARARRGRKALFGPEIRLLPGVFPALPDIRPGDRVRVALPDAGFASFEDEFMVSGISVEVADEGAETVRLEVVPIELIEKGADE